MGPVLKAPKRQGWAFAGFASVLKGLLFLALSALAISQLSPLFSTTLFFLKPEEPQRLLGESLTLQLPPDNKGLYRDFLRIKIKVDNPRHLLIPTTTLSVLWKGEGESELNDRSKERFPVFVDNTFHEYSIPLGENKYWKGPVGDLILQLPRPKDLEVTLAYLSLQRRVAFAPDAYLGRYLKGRFEIREMDRLLVVSYILLLLVLAIALIHYAIAKKKTLALPPVGDSPSYLPSEDTDYKRTDPGSSPGQPSSSSLPIILLAVLLISFLPSLGREVLTLRAYYRTYQHLIHGGDLSKSYAGFADFDYFLWWCDTNIPPDEDAVLLLQGNPEYVLARAAYILYPRDTRVIDTSSGDLSDISRRIFEERATYLIGLHKKDLLMPGLVLEKQYSPRGGYILKKEGFDP